jgi:hypothetical protein
MNEATEIPFHCKEKFKKFNIRSFNGKTFTRVEINYGIVITYHVLFSQKMREFCFSNN